MVLVLAYLVSPSFCLTKPQQSRRGELSLLRNILQRTELRLTAHKTALNMFAARFMIALIHGNVPYFMSYILPELGRKRIDEVFANGFDVDRTNCGVVYQFASNRTSRLLVQ